MAVDASRGPLLLTAPDAVVRDRVVLPVYLAGVCDDRFDAQEVSFVADLAKVRGEITWEVLFSNLNKFVLVLSNRALLEDTIVINRYLLETANINEFLCCTFLTRILNHKRFHVNKN